MAGQDLISPRSVDSSRLNVCETFLGEALNQRLQACEKLVASLYPSFSAI